MCGKSGSKKESPSFRGMIILMHLESFIKGNGDRVRSLPQMRVKKIPPFCKGGNGGFRMIAAGFTFSQFGQPPGDSG